MSEKIINIQDAFLNYMRKNKIPVTVFLLNGVKLYGVISCFDQKSVVIKREGHSQLVYKHAVSTYSPHGNVTIFDWNGGGSFDKSLKTKEEQQDYDEEFEEEFSFEEDYDDEEYGEGEDR